MTLLDEMREVLRQDHVTFAQLSRLPGFAGDLAMLVNSPRASNIVYWDGLSQEAVDGLEIIRREGEYEIVPTVSLTYLIDGMAMTLPIAKRARHYKKPHWMPMVFRRRK